MRCVLFMRFFAAFWDFLHLFPSYFITLMIFRICLLSCTLTPLSKTNFTFLLSSLLITNLQSRIMSFLSFLLEIVSDSESCFSELLGNSEFKHFLFSGILVVVCSFLFMIPTLENGIGFIVIGVISKESEIFIVGCGILQTTESLEEDSEEFLLKKSTRSSIFCSELFSNLLQDFLSGTLVITLHLCFSLTGLK